MEKAITTPAHERIVKPDIPRGLNFEQQIKEIDDAINGSVSSLNSITAQEALLSKESNMQATHVATLKLEEQIQASGLKLLSKPNHSHLGLRAIYISPCMKVRRTWACSTLKAGGLALLWRNSLQVDILSYSPRHIDAIVSEEQGMKK
ncbi:hypothetical protein CFP56_036742 [Quercus suber]|uniref:Uncharacterized protein n=1 Tax=Quercus suber TaxID=58331 RepID=A0AAW0M9W7_QUESU